MRDDRPGFTNGLDWHPVVIGEVTVRRNALRVVRHAVQRWEEAGIARDPLEALASGTWSREAPAGVRLRPWHAARARGFVEVPEGTFVVTDNPDGHLYVTTFVSRERYWGAEEARLRGWK